MGYQLLADLTLTLHLLFILFALFGGLLCLHRKAWACLHLPALAWGIWVEWAGELCPLTPLENHFRQLANQSGYQGGFIEHYLLSLIYPSGLTREIQWVLGALLLVLNLCIYSYLIFKNKKRSTPVDE